MATLGISQASYGASLCRAIRRRCARASSRSIYSAAPCCWPRRIRAATRWSYCAPRAASSSRCQCHASAATSPPPPLIAGSCSNSGKSNCCTSAPAARKRSSAASKACCTCCSTPAPTKSGVWPKRRPLSDGAGKACSWPDSAACKIAQQSTLLAIGPAESSERESGTVPASDTVAAVGLKPVRPQKADGMRIEPPVSVPSAPAAMSSATVTAPPEVDPPATRVASYGLRGVP